MRNKPDKMNGDGLLIESGNSFDSISDIELIDVFTLGGKGIDIVYSINMGFVFNRNTFFDYKNE